MTRIGTMAAVMLVAGACVNSARSRQDQGGGPVGPMSSPTGIGYPPPGPSLPPPGGGYPPVATASPSPGVGPTATPTPTIGGSPGVVEFRIPPGTGKGPWNTREQPVIIKLPATGSVTLRVINDDTTPHVMHTDGVPCPHAPIGKPLKKGEAYDCVIRRPFDSTAGGVLYDHNFGTSAFFYVRATR